MSEKQIEQYKQLHKNNSNYGTSGVEFFEEICLIIDYLKPDTVLDFGCGKGTLIKALEQKYSDITFYGYDPAIPGKDVLPTDKVDLVLNTDVLEHIPQNELPNVVEKIASLSDKVIFQLHHALASAYLPNGENAHCTVKPVNWYQELFSKYFENQVVLKGRQEYLSMIWTFPVLPHIIEQYYEIIKPTTITNNPSLPEKKNKSFLQKIFSVQNEYKENKKYKVITIIGIKIKLKIKTLSNAVVEPLSGGGGWLTLNRMERMDANRDDLFDKTRCEFHLDRYRFACQYTKNKHCIDCASGTGYGADLISKLGNAASVKGLEINSEACSYAEKNYGTKNVSFKQGSILNIPFDDNTFDVFTSFETIEHVEDEERQLSEIARVLKKDGLYIMSTPNDWKSNIINPYHVRKYNYKSLKETLSKRFEILAIYNQNSGTPNRPENNNLPRAIYLTTKENHHVAECFIAVCKVIK